MTETLSIRPAVHSDLGAFFAYLDDHLADNGQGRTALFQPMPRGESRLSADKAARFTQGLATALGEPGWRRLWLAQDGASAIAGHIDLRARPEPLAGHRALLGMGVHREHRRNGLGARLVQTALHWAAAQPLLAWVDLEVLSVNTAARQLYTRAGFATCGELPDMFRIDGEQHAYTLMTRKL